MIREIFLPNSLFAQNIIGLEIGRHSVVASEVVQKKQSFKVKKIVTTAIEGSTERTVEEQAVNAINSALSQVKGDQIRLIIPNNLVFFKELSVPFTDKQKIKMILGYEIESSLPFSLSDAVLDFVITKQTKQSSSVLVAVAQKKQLDFYLHLVAKSKRRISAITIDLIGTYGIYKLALSGNKNKYQMILELGKTSVTITHLVGNSIAQVRNLPYGISSIVAKIAGQTKQPQAEVFESLLRFGIQDQAEIAPHFDKLMHDISFTVNSFSAKSSAKIAQCLVIESAIEIKEFAKYVSTKVGDRKSTRSELQSQR